MLRCYLGHWLWWCPAENGVHHCPQFCRCCSFQVPDPTFRFNVVNMHLENKCDCNRKCGCHKWFERE
jgi:hypothetical protein